MTSSPSTTTSELGALGGATLTRLDRPSASLLALTFDADAPQVLLLCALRESGLVGLTRARPRGRAVDGLGLTLRRVLEGARLVALTRGDHGASASFETEHGPRTLRVVATRAWSGFQLLDGERLLLGEPAADADRATERETTRAELAEQGSTLLARATELAFASRRADMAKLVRRKLAKLERTLEAVRGDAERAASADALRRDADLIMAHAHDDRAGRTRLAVVDFHGDPPAPRDLVLDPRTGPRTQAAQLYAKARKLERGAALAATRLAELDRRRAPLAAAERALREATDEAALDAVERAHPDLALEDAVARMRRKGPAERVPYRVFESRLGTRIRVGKSAADNDALTLHARSHDLFVHARGVPGSHVIVDVARGRTASPEDVLDAATLAAHFSSLRGETIVEVSLAQRRHVRKPKGAAKGTVLLDAERVISLRVEPERLARLLAAERG